MNNKIIYQNNQNNIQYVEQIQFIPKKNNKKNFLKQIKNFFIKLFFKTI